MNKRGISIFKTIFLSIILLIGLSIVIITNYSFLENIITGLATDEEESLGEKCSFTTAYWSAYQQTIISIGEGENAELVVEGNNCEDEEINLKLFNSRGELITNLGETSFISNQASKIWTAESTSQEYYFIATMASDASISINSNLLTVTPLTGIACNDGIDNDGDGWVDYNFDPGCDNSEDDDETNSDTGFQCSDNLDNNNNDLIDGFDPGCTVWFDDNENSESFEQEDETANQAGNGTEESISCDFYNNITDFVTCDYRFTLQNSYFGENLSHLGLSNEGWTISGAFLLAGVGETIDEFINATEDEIRDKLVSYINRPDIELTEDTTDFVILDMEHPIQPFDIWRYNDTTTPTQNEVIDAFSLRIKVAREVLINAKISMYGIVVGTSTGVINEAHTNRMSGFIAAGDRGMYDQLDYVTPVLYQWNPPNHEDHATLEQFTRTVIESSQSLTKSDGTSLNLAPVLGTRYRNEDPETGEIVWITTEDQLLQLSVIQEYNSIKVITYWSPEEIISSFPEYFEDVKPVPCGCAT